MVMPPPQVYEGSSANTRFIGRMMHAQDMFNRVDNVMHEALRFDDIYGKCDTDLKRIQIDIDDYVRKWPPCTFMDKFKGPFHLYPWQDPVIWNILMNIKDKERELAVLLGEIPHYT